MLTYGRCFAGAGGILVSTQEAKKGTPTDIILMNSVVNHSENRRNRRV